MAPRPLPTPGLSPPSVHRLALGVFPLLLCLQFPLLTSARLNATQLPGCVHSATRHLIQRPLPRRSRSTGVSLMPLSVLSPWSLESNPFLIPLICCCCLVAQLCLTLCNPMDFSMLGFPVLHYLPEFAQTHILWVHDAIQPSHPLSFPSPLCPQSFPASGPFPISQFFHIRWPKYWSFSFSISPPNEYSGFPLGWTGWISLLSKGLSRVFSNTTVQKHQFFSAQLSL